MKDSEPNPGNNPEGGEKKSQPGQIMSIIVAIGGTIFLFFWFLLYKQQSSLPIYLYCLAPLIMLLVLNFSLNLAYKVGKN